MNIWHGCFDNNNFGDHVGNYVIEKLTGEKPKFAHDSRKVDEVHVYSGSVLQESKRNWVMYGCGFGEDDQQIHEAPKQIVSVRGKLSREMLLKQGIECPEIYFDICEYLPSIYYPKIKKKYAFGYIPHYNDSSMVLLADKENDIMIDICGQPEEIITQALSCNRIVSSSLHGLILADVYSIPRDWKRFDGVSDFKFYDYFSKFK